MTACGCIGPQNGEPVCPCQMRGVKVIDGRYVRTQDLGPAPDGGMPKHLWGPSTRTNGPTTGTRVLDAVTGRDLGSAD